MTHHMDDGGLDLVRKALEGPDAQACMSPDKLRREIRRLETRLAAVRERGGAYAGVDFSGDVRLLLARLEAGHALSACVH